MTDILAAIHKQQIAFLTRYGQHPNVLIIHPAARYEPPRGDVLIDTVHERYQPHGAHR